MGLTQPPSGGDKTCLVEWQRMKRVGDDNDPVFVFDSVVRSSLFGKVAFVFKFETCDAEMKLSAESQRRGN